MKTPRNREEFESMFGKFNYRDNAPGIPPGAIVIDPKWRTENIVLVETPWTGPSGKVIKAWVHRLLVDVFVSTVEEASKVTYQVTRVDSFVPRHRNWRATGPLSVHSWGAAIDINPMANMVGTSGDMPKEFVDVWKKHGWCWGGNWRRPKDPMHFQFWKE